MKSKHCVIAVIICVIIVLISLYFLILSILSTSFGKKLKDTTIMEIFRSNRLLFENVVEELNNINEITIREDSNTSYILTLKNNEKIFINSEDSSTEYINCINIMKTLKITYLSKVDNNIVFMINSMFGLGQSIVFISDIEKYKQSHIITKIINIHDSWYYIETK